MFNAVNDTMKKLSVPELVQVAQGISGDPGMQFAAVQELDLRRRHAAIPQPQTKTVLQGMAEQAMGSPNSSAAPGDPVASGVAAIAAQQQMQPPGYRDGGLVTRMNSIMDTLSQNYDMNTMTPDEARDLVSEFMPDNSESYDAADLRAKNADAAARRQRNSNLWLALAQGGLGLADRGRWGDVMPAFASAQGAIDDFSAELNRNEDRRTRTSEQRRAEGNDRGARGLDAIMRSRAEASEERRSLRRDAAGLAETEARIAAERDQVRVLAAQLMEANAGQMVQDGDSVSPMGQDIPYLRPYNEQDALNDAISLVTGGGRRSGSGSSPDDLNEILRSAIELANPMNMAPDDVRARAQQTLDEIMSGRLGNAQSSTGNRSAPTGTRAPSEPGYIARAREQAAEYARQRSAAQQPDGTIRDLNGNPIR